MRRGVFGTDADRGQLYGNLNDLNGVKETLYSENIPKGSDASNKEATVGLSCSGAERGDWEPVQDFNAVVRDEMISYQTRIQKMDVMVKNSCSAVQALRVENVDLHFQLRSMRASCELLYQHLQALSAKDRFKTDIIHEMRRQLRQAKAKFKELKERESQDSVQCDSYDLSPQHCVREQPRRSRDLETPDLETLCRSRDPETPRRSRDQGKSCRSRYLETQCRSRDLETQCRSHFLEMPCRSRDLETPCRLRDLETPCRSHYLESPSLSCDSAAPSRSHNLEVPDLETPRRSRNMETPRSLSDSCSPRLVMSKEDLLSILPIEDPE